MAQYPRAILFLLVIAFISRAVAVAEKQAYGNENTEEDGEDLGESSLSSVSPFSNLKDWSYYNYSSNHWAARSSVASWNGKFYDPLAFKGGENDTYGNYYLAQYKNSTKSNELFSSRFSPWDRGCVRFS
jgi:hypothetical protein